MGLPRCAACPLSIRGRAALQTPLHAWSPLGQRKIWIDETVRIPDTDEAFPAEAPHLVGVVWDNMHVLNQVHLRYAIPKLRVDIVELIPEKLFGSLLFGQKVRVRRDHSHTDDVLVERN